LQPAVRPDIYGSATDERGSVSNAQSVQTIYEAFGRGDVPAILDLMSDSVEWEQWEGSNNGQDAGVPWLVRRSGKDGVAAFFQALAENLEVHSFVPVNLLEGGGQVAATISIDGTVTKTGERFQDEEIHLWTFDESGKVTGFRHYTDTAKHIEAVTGSPAGVT
jgi:ketosteroid isomerase-like protein